MKEKLFKKGITRRLFSVALALAMVVALMPNLTMTVHAASENYTLYLKADGTATKNTASGEAVTPLPTGLSYDSGTGVWTMNNFTFVTTKQVGVNCDGTNFKLNIIGNNTIKSVCENGGSDHESKGMNGGDITITGDGTLTVVGGNVNNPDVSVGIAANSLTVNGGTVKATAGEGYASRGISAKLTVNGGHVMANAMAARSFENGIYNATTVNGGCLEVFGGFASWVDITIGEGLKVVAGANAGTATKPTFNTDWKTTLNSKRYVKIGTSGHELGDDSAKSQPKTGVMDTLPMWFGVMAVSAAAYVLTSKKRFF